MDGESPATIRNLQCELGIDVPGIATLVPVGLGLLFALAYRKLRAVRLFLTLASPAILVFPVVFIFATPVSKVVLAQPPPSRADALSPAPDSHVIFLILDLLPVTALMDEHQDLDAERYPGFASWAFLRGCWISHVTSFE